MLKQNFSFLRMVKRVIEYLNENEELWQDNDILKAIVVKITSMYKEIEKYLLQQQKKNIGYANEKRKQKRILVTNIDIIISAIEAYAFSINDDVLLGKLKYSNSDLFYMKDLELETCATNSIQIASNLIDNLIGYGVTQEIIDTLTLEVKNFNEIISKPALAIKRRKTATQSINTLIKELRVIMKLSLDNVVKQYKLTNHEFYHEYTNQREIIDIPIHKLSLKGKVTDIKTEEPLLDVIITIPELKKETESTKLGNYQFKNIKRGTYKVELQRDGYKPKTLATEILDNQTTDMNMEMERV